MFEYAKRTAIAYAIAVSVLLGLVSTSSAVDQPYKVSVESAKVKVGETAQIKVTVTAAEGWHANFRYPHKIDGLSAPGGAELAFKSVRASKAAGRTIVFVIAVKATEAGTHKITGDIMFSVADGPKKLTEKVPLEATVTAEKAGT